MLLAEAQMASLAYYDKKVDAATHRNEVNVVTQEDGRPAEDGKVPYTPIALMIAVTTESRNHMQDNGVYSLSVDHHSYVFRDRKAQGKILALSPGSAGVHARGLVISQSAIGQLLHMSVGPHRGLDINKQTLLRRQTR